MCLISEKINIIHAHDIRASIIASMFYKKAKIISHVHANHENMRKYNLKTILYNFSTKKIDKLIWVSKSALDNYRFYNIIKDKSIVLYNIINPDEVIKKIKDDKNNYDNFDIIYLGRLSFQKNPQRLINIIEKIVEEKKDLKVAIVGNGEFEEEIRNSISEKDLSNNITMFGFVANPYKILNSSKDEGKFSINTTCSTTLIS